MLAPQRNHLTTHFSEHFPVVSQGLTGPSHRDIVPQHEGLGGTQSSLPFPLAQPTLSLRLANCSSCLKTHQKDLLLSEAILGSYWVPVARCPVSGGEVATLYENVYTSIVPGASECLEGLDLWCIFFEDPVSSPGGSTGC